MDSTRRTGFSFPERMRNLKAMVSKGYRNPTIREMYMFPPANPELKPEKLINYELSYSQRLLEGVLSYGMSLYYINGDNMIMSNGLCSSIEYQLRRDRELGS